MNDFVRNTVIGTIVIVVVLLILLLVVGVIAAVGWIFGENVAIIVTIIAFIVFMGALLGNSLDD